MTQPWLTLVIIVLVLLALTCWVVWWQWDYRNNAFNRAQKEIQRACGGQDRYDSTRILMLGDEEMNRLLCRSWSLTDGLEHWFGQWWFNPQCSLLCVPQALQNPGKKHLIRQNEWQKTLAALVRSRPQRPLDALIVTLPLEALIGGDNTRVQLLNNCQQIQQVCGLSLPIYLLIGGLESLDGMQALLEMLPEQARRSAIGSPIPVAREAVWKPQWIDDALDNTRHALRQVICELGALNGQTPPSLFRLPASFLPLATPLHDYFDSLLSNNARDEPPLLRGIWFVARSITDDKPQMQFCQNLLDGKIAAERGLAMPVRRLLRLNLRRQFVTLTCYSCLCVLWLAVMTWRWQYQHTNALLLHDRLQLLASQTAEPGAPGERTAAFYWRILNAIPQWQFSSVVWPGSLFSRTDGKLRETLHSATLTSLLLPAANGVCQQNLNVLRNEEDAREDLLPDERYRQIEALLGETKQMETRYLPLLQLLQVKQPTVTTLANVSSSIWGVTVDVDSLPAQDSLNALFATLNIARLHLPDASELTRRNSELFSRETMRWLEQNYGDASLDDSEERLEKLLALFSNDTRITPLFVRSLVRQIGRLQATLATINNLSRDAAHSPVRLPLDELLTQARGLRLIDNRVIPQLLRHEALLRQRFMAQVDDSRLHFSSLTEQSPDGNFSVSPDILALQKSLRDLLNHPFWQRGVDLTPIASTGYPGVLQLQQAQQLFSGYQRYVQQLPDSLWRPKLVALAQNAVENAMNLALYADAPDSAQGSAVSIADADRVIDAFSQLARPQLAARLRQQIAAQVMARVSQQGGALLPNMAPPAIAYATPEQAQASGERIAAWSTAQAEQISATLTRYQQDVTWLDGQRPWLSAAENQQIVRWVNSLNAMQRLLQQDPTTPPAQMTTLATALPTLTAQNCQSELAQFTASGGNDFYSQSLTALVGAAQQNCRQLRQQASVSTTQKIFNLYNVWLAGHFPFTAVPHAPDADVVRVRELTVLLDTLPPESLTGQPPLIQQLAAAKPLLAALVSPKGVAVRVLWRTSRNNETGADQIVDWRLSGNQQTLSYPGGAEVDLHWRSGDALSVSLRWAKNSAWRPLPGASQPGITVVGDTGRWRWQGAWSLLRMIAQQRVGGALAQPLPLRFTLPVGDGQLRATTTVYLQVALLDAEGKAPLPWVRLTEQGLSGED
ncbi:type VI secretion system protein [Citrobacter sp. RHB21-C01]|uniref:type VI secretion system protein n=1 Tax=Citrobacter sp. RHB21-C01 TaxID=2742622 RepID=UPI0034D3B262